MKIEKNKIVFTTVILCVVLFIGSYSVIMLEDGEGQTIEINQIPVPELGGEQKEYDSKLEALDELKERGQTNVPSIYDERLLDSTGVYDPNLLDKEKMWIVDSIYNEGCISYSDRSFRKSNVKIEPEPVQKDSTPEIDMQENDISPKELGLEDQLFFVSNPLENENLITQNTDAFIYVQVDGTQTVRNNYRLQMRLTKDALMNNFSFSKNTTVCGF